MDEAVGALKDKYERERSMLTEDNSKLTAETDRVRTTHRYRGTRCGKDRCCEWTLNLTLSLATALFFSPPPLSTSFLLSPFLSLFPLSPPLSISPTISRSPPPSSAISCFLSLSCVRLWTS